MLTHGELDNTGQMKRRSAYVRVTCRSAFDAMDDAMAQIAGFGDHADLPAEDAIKLQLVIEELLTNSIRHGRCGERNAIEIDLWANDHQVRIAYADRGIAFDPTKYNAPSPENQGEAGYGWVLIKGICQSIDYARANDVNKTSLLMPLGGS